jgi:hypothetical protein
MEQIAIWCAIVATIIAVWFAIRSALIRRNSEASKKKVITDTAKDILLRTYTAFLSSRALAIGAFLRKSDLLSQINDIEIPATYIHISIWDAELCIILNKIEEVVKSVKAEEGYREQEVLEIVTNVIHEVRDIMRYEIGDELYILIKKIDAKKMSFEAELASYIKDFGGC